MFSGLCFIDWSARILAGKLVRLFTAWVISRNEIKQEIPLGHRKTPARLQNVQKLQNVTSRLISNTTRKYIYNIPLSYHSISEWSWLFKITQGQIHIRLYIYMYGFQIMLNTNIGPKAGSLRDIRLRNLDDLDLNLSRSLKVKRSGAIGLPIYDLISVFSDTRE